LRPSRCAGQGQDDDGGDQVLHLQGFHRGVQGRLVHHVGIKNRVLAIKSAARPET
jgi:hypothetical protein